MNANLRQAGLRFLKLLGRHAEPIMDAYLSGELPDHLHDPSTQELLVKHGVLYRPEPGADLRLRRVVRALLEESLKDDRNRQIDANFGSALVTLKTLSTHYKEARHNHDFAAAEAYHSDLSEHVYAFGEGLHHGIRMLWGRINNEFGYVGTINAKIRENELAQTQVSELLAGLEMVSFEELTEIAGDMRELRRLLVTILQATISECAQELGIVQARLLELLGRFREIRGRTRLLKGWLLYTEQHPDYSIGNHVAHKVIPRLFNQADPILAPAHADLHNPLQEADLLTIVAGLRIQAAIPGLSRAPAEAEPTALEEVQDFELPRSLIKEAVGEYFCTVIDSGAPLSALVYLERHRLPWDAESWLYQVIGGYENLPAEQKRHFELDLIGETHPVYRGNFIIHDVALWLA